MARGWPVTAATCLAPATPSWLYRPAAGLPGMAAAPAPIAARVVSAPAESAMAKAIGPAVTTAAAGRTSLSAAACSAAHEPRCTECMTAAVIPSASEEVGAGRSHRSSRGEAAVAATTGPAVAKPELAEAGVAAATGPAAAKPELAAATGPAATAPSWLHRRAAAAPSMGAGPAAASAAAPAPAMAGVVSALATSALAAAMGRAALEAAICPAAGGDAATPSWLHRPDAEP